jgi:hypothetical protein
MHLKSRRLGVETPACARQCSPDLNKLADMSSTPFHLYVWPQRLLMLAPAYASAQHRHHLAQIAFGLNGPVVYESPQTGLHRADLILVPPDTPHAHPAFGTSAVLYLEPESNEWARFPGRDSAGLAALPFNPQLRAVARRAAAGDAVAAQSLVDNLIDRLRTAAQALTRWSRRFARSCVSVSTDRSRWRRWRRPCTALRAGWRTASAKRPACPCGAMFYGAVCARRQKRPCVDRA